MSDPMPTIEINDTDQVFIFRKSFGQGEVKECGPNDMLVYLKSYRDSWQWTQVYIGGELVGPLLKGLFIRATEMGHPQVELETLSPHTSGISEALKESLIKHLTLLERLLPFSRITELGRWGAVERIRGGR